MALSFAAWSAMEGCKGLAAKATKRKLRTRFRAPHPLDLLSRMREARQHVATCSECGSPPAETETPDRIALAEFLFSLGTAWPDGEVIPTHQRKDGVPHTWRSRQDPFEHTWPTIQQWLESEPGTTARKLHERLVALAPAMYSSAQRRLKAWRSNRARELVTRILGDADAMKAGVTSSRKATRRPT
ncbi:hypothetical protein VSR34_36490 [Paraburkholderia sp. JHI2823]|uniref:hypothetical protein n=1 Tax=Paraburkholderia sp. JHI2823 TaxID=3112960 RepID=UPI00317D6660